MLGQIDVPLGVDEIQYAKRSQISHSLVYQIDLGVTLDFSG